MLSSRVLIFAGIALFALVNGHSQMRCAKYNKATGECSAPIRNQAVSYLSESNSGPMCQTPMSNPISNAYANGADCPSWAPCPLPMGTYSPGESFTIMWLARNHATDDQQPRTVKLYMSPKENANQGADVSRDVMNQNLICQGPFKNCGGANVDMTPCTLDCVMPTSTQPGFYTLLWVWDWTVNDGKVYTTCADIQVTGGSSGNSNPTPATPAPTPITSGRALSPTPATTGRQQTTPSTTGRQQATPATTGRKPVTPTNPPTPPTTGKRNSVTTGTAAPIGGGIQCTLGHQRCSGENTYQTCGRSSSTSTDWSQSQSCPTGLSCHQVQGSYVWCY